jgi:hypothetical protein
LENTALLSYHLERDYIDAVKTPIHISATALSLRGRRCRHRLSSDAHSMNVCLIVALSDLKMTPFLRFQSCQQQSAMRVLKCIGGIGAGLRRFCYAIRYTLSRYIVKAMHLEKPKCLIIWNGVIFS